MKAPELLAMLEKTFPNAEITRELKQSKNTKYMIDNHYVDGKLAVKGRFGEVDSYHFCNSFRLLSEFMK